MLTISNLKESFKEGAFRTFKVFQFGAKTASEVSPYGVDSNPRIGNDLDAIFSETSAGGETVILGFIQENRFAEEGEIRLFSENEDGITSAYVWLTKDGNVNINGRTDNLVKFKAFAAANLKLQQDLNIEFTKIQTALSAIGGAYLKTDIQIDVSGAKAENITTK